MIFSSAEELKKRKLKKIDRLTFERQLWSEGFQRIMGLDEVGRGCLAGPVVAAGVIFRPGVNITGVRDSKKMSEKERNSLAEVIKDEALFWAIQECSLKEIEELNILWASIAAMQKCVNEPVTSPDYLLVDGNKWRSSDLIPYTCLTKGDDRSLSIAAASVLAKVYRDEKMRGLHKEYPQYGWDTNVGYPTIKHREALQKWGYTKYHRSNFRLGVQFRYGDS